MTAADRTAYWQRRAHAAEAQLDFAKEDRESALRWGQEESRRNVRLSDRCTFLYGAAVKHGATNEELAQAWPPEEAAQLREAAS